MGKLVRPYVFLSRPPPFQAPPLPFVSNVRTANLCRIGAAAFFSLQRRSMTLYSWYCSEYRTHGWYSLAAAVLFLLRFSMTLGWLVLQRVPSNSTRPYLFADIQMRPNKKWGLLTGQCGKSGTERPLQMSIHQTRI